MATASSASPTRAQAVQRTERSRRAVAAAQDTFEARVDDREEDKHEVFYVNFRNMRLEEEKEWFRTERFNLREEQAFAMWKPQVESVEAAGGELVCSGRQE